MRTFLEGAAHVERWHPASVLALGSMLAVACTGADSASTSTTILDSAGVRIVESSAPAWREGEGWTLGAEPTLQIGVADGDSSLQFDGLMGVRRLTDGRIIVGDQGSVQLRVFDGEGRHLTTLGRRGGGPGELDDLTGAYIVGGDTLVARSTHEVVVFAPDGRVVRKVTPEPPPGRRFANLVDVLADGSIVSASFPPLGNLHDDSSDGSLTLHRHARTGEWRGRLARFEWATMIPATSIAGRVRVWDQPLLSALAPFEITGAWVYTARTDRFEIQAFDTTGTLRRILRRPWDLTPVSESDRERFRDASLVEPTEGGRTPSAPVVEARRRRLDELPFVTHLAPLDRILAAEDGHLWVRHLDARWFVEEGYRGGAAPRASAWSVFDSTGRWLGEITLPARFYPSTITGREVLGVWRDDDDVQYVRVYELIKP